MFIIYGFIPLIVIGIINRGLTLELFKLYVVLIAFMYIIPLLLFILTAKVNVDNEGLVFFFLFF